MIDIAAKINEAYEKDRRVYPCRSNRASEIGHPCARYLTYCRLNWKEKRLPSAELCQIFEMGNFFEDLAVKRLQKAGLEITNQQRDFEDKRHEITGHVDGFLEHEKQIIPLEIKGINQRDWDNVNSVEDMMFAPKPWLRKYPGQLQAYLYLAEAPLGVFIMVNKANSLIKPIWMQLDYDYMELLLKKLEKVNACVQTGTYPDRIDYDEVMCGDCPFSHLCLPEVINKARITFEADPDFEAKLDRRQELSEAAAEYNRLDKYIKATAKAFEADNVVIGKYMISRKWQLRHEEARPERNVEIITIKIQLLSKEAAV